MKIFFVSLSLSLCCDSYSYETFLIEKILQWIYIDLTELKTEK